MAGFKETIRVIEATPHDQATLLTGYHGIGKSESIRDHFQSKGYRMITLFVGQMADAGDVIGLPDRKEINVEYTDTDGNTHTEKTKITEFCPPKWWPLDMNEKVIIFLDEVNRGKPELMQCLMDMILNRKLNGRDLPPKTRIIGAMNPMEEGYYQVEELDPAFIDRWNVIELIPTTEEWLSWAAMNKVHIDVMGFISKHVDHLDPPSPKDAKSGEIYPSRRSWVKVSGFLKKNPNIRESDLHTYLFSCVGTRSAAAYLAYMKSKKNGLMAGVMITNWDDKYITNIQTMSSTEIIHFNTQIAMWFEANEQMLTDKNPQTYAWNLEKYLNIIDVEFMAQFFDFVAVANKDKKEWAGIIMDANPKLSERFVSVLHGNDDEEEDENNSSWE